MIEVNPTVHSTITPWLLEQKRLQNLPGTLSPCPFCQTPRQLRSDYIRCTPCGINWLKGEDLNHDPSIERHKAHLKSVHDSMPF